MTHALRCIPPALLAISAILTCCRSPRVDVTVENRTGAAIELLEVDYPSASFGADRLASGAVYRYRIQIRGAGPVRVQYTDPLTQQPRQATGPDLQERQSGALEIKLLPAGRAEFHPALTSTP
jgi:hypothetical protein